MQNPSPATGASPATRCLPFVSTGIAGFDQILGGGFPSHSVYLIQGLAGSGKTTLACQIAFDRARHGGKVLVMTLIAETHGKMLNHLSNFSFFDESLVGTQIVFHSAYGELARGGLRDLLKFIAGTLAAHKPDLLIIDGFRSVRESSPSDLKLSEFMLSLNSLASSMTCTTFLLSPTEGNVADSENTLVDGLIELSQHEDGLRLIREIKVFKVRGSKHMLGKHVFEVGEDGLVIYPRLEAVTTLNNTPPPASSELVSFGIPGWDKLTNGGVVRGSTTNLLGNPGVGKTLMGLHFLHDGLMRGEPCMVIGFYESPQRLVEKGRNIGLDLAPFIANGSLQILWQPPLEVLVDGLANRALRLIGEGRVQRLLVDGLDGLRDIVTHVGRSRSFLAALVNELRCRQVTTFFTQELAYVGDSHLSNMSASMLFENIMLLQYVEIGGINHRQVAVLKLRANGYDAANHLMAISDHGMSVERPVSEALMEHQTLMARAARNGQQ